jgi:uncharacterized protein (TIGR03086 family)
MSEISERYRALARELTRRVDAVPVGRWDDPSPCQGWSARDVLNHLLDSHRDMPGHAGHPLVFEKSVDDDPHAAWVEARDAMQKLLDDPDRAGMEYDGMFGRTSVEKTVDKFLGLDLLVHGWDIARATGQDERLPEEEVTRVYQDALSLGDSLRMGGVCGPAVEVPADASEQDKLLATLGRTP